MLFVSETFGNESGTIRCLQVNQDDLSPSQRITKTDWIRFVTDIATVGKNHITGNLFGNILVFIHGYNSSISIVLQRHRIIRQYLSMVGYKGAVVSFDWPSNDEALNSLEDRKDAKLTAIK